MVLQYSPVNGNLLIQTKDGVINKCNSLMNKCHCCSYRWTIPGNSSQLRLLTQQQLKDSYLTYYHMWRKPESSLTKSSSCACCSSHIFMLQSAPFRRQQSEINVAQFFKSVTSNLTWKSARVSLPPCTASSHSGSKTPAHPERIHRRARLEESIGFSKITDTRLNLSTVHFNQSGICRHTVQDTGVYLGVIHC